MIENPTNREAKLAVSKSLAFEMLTPEEVREMGAWIDLTMMFKHGLRYSKGFTPEALETAARKFAFQNRPSAAGAVKKYERWVNAFMNSGHDGGRFDELL